MRAVSCFNPRPHARGDTHRMVSPRWATSFNPRPHARGDRGVCVMYRPPSVSIHAPTRGATGIPSDNKRLKKFQSTPPREGRRCHQFHHAMENSFNPRPHARGDQFINAGFNPLKVSIHAPTRGATGEALVLRTLQYVSIHAPTRGATAVAVRPLYTLSVSIHAPTRGATWRGSRSSHSPVCFNPRPHARGDDRNVL